MTRLPRILVVALLLAPLVQMPAAEAAKKNKERGASRRAETPAPTHPPLQPVDITRLPEGVERLDLYLLMGQSNMKGRGVMPDEPQRDLRLVMMHLTDDQWYLARHPLHLTGDAKTFEGADNAGVGAGLSFAETLAARDSKVRIGLIPCAKGGTRIARWQKGATLYEESVRRAKLALRTGTPAHARICGALWLQGEADARREELPVYEAKLLKLVDDLRTDLADPRLPFIACTIGEMGDLAKLEHQAAMNHILLSLPGKRPQTGCVDARDLKGNIGDNVHYDTASQNEIGRRYAQQLLQLGQPK